MKIILILIAVKISFSLTYDPRSYVNTFEATRGCLQFSIKSGQHPYLPTARFKHLKTSSKNVTIMRMGVLAGEGPHIRLSPVEFPFDVKINEIVLSAWSNTASEIRTYVRKANGNVSDLQVLRRINSPGLVSEFYPMMFTLQIDSSGNVKLIKDGDQVPLVEYQYRGIAFDYIGFVNYLVPATFFFDCPLEIDYRDCSAVVFG